MRKIRTLSVFLAAIIALTAASQSKAQNQSMLLPVPGTYSTGSIDYDGCKVINFSNSGNPVITDLPRHPFIAFGLTGRPHIEGDLADAIPSINEKYLGQHPMFCQSIVHDKDGNLLFFIVDENIYNRYGEAMLAADDNGLPLAGTMAKLSTFGNDNTIPDELNRWNLDSVSYSANMIICPLSSDCYDYGIFFMHLKSSANEGGAVDMHFRKIKFIDDNLMDMGGYLTIDDLYPGLEPCSDDMADGLAIAPYDTGYFKYLLFYRSSDVVGVFKVSLDGVFDRNEDNKITIADADWVRLPATGVIDSNDQIHNHLRLLNSEMEALKVNKQGETYYQVAVGQRREIAGNTSYALVSVLIYDETGTYQTHRTIVLPGNVEKEAISGLEFSADGSKLYVTYYGQTNMYYIDVVYEVQSNTIGLGLNSMQNQVSSSGAFYYSHIERGRDGCIYYPYSNNDEVGGLAIVHPSAPGILMNDTTGISKMYYSHDVFAAPPEIQKKLILANQIDGSDYSGWYDNVSDQCCTDHIYWSLWPDSNYFSGHQTCTWSNGTENNPFNVFNGVVLIGEDVLLPEGVNLTIHNLDFKFNQGAKLVVSKGAKLVIDNSNLKHSSECGNEGLWQGIELRGDGNESQLTQGAQGEVEIINGGTIENAVCGIYVGERDGNGNPLPNTGGGIVKATGAVFKNCVEAVHYTPYKNFNPNDQNHPEIINTGYFTNCTFETDDAYYSMTSMLPKSFFTLEGIKGLRLKGNTFQNTSDDARPAQERGNGITSCDATFYLQPGCLTQTLPCSQPDPNVFEKLNYAIYAANTKPLIPIYVKDNVFTDNFRSMRISGMKGAVISGNTIDVGKSTGPMGHNLYWNDAYGIHLEGCTGYQIQNNTFETDDDGRYGIIISNSGIKANLLNNNTFNGLLIACQAEGINGSTPYYGASVGNINTGLIFKCNEYSGNTVTDISVTSGTIDVEQGLCTDTYGPAGNTFVNHGNLGNLWAGSGVTPFRYNCHGDEATTPYVINPVAAVHNCDISYSSQSCALPYGNYNIEELQQIINIKAAALSEMKRKIDGGNTQALLDYIDTRPDGGELRDLLAYSHAPYVSDEVLIKTIFYHDTISDGQLADVIVANSPVTESVMSMLNKINIEAGKREAIINAQTGISARFLLEDSINNAQTELDYASNELLTILMSDTALTGAGIISGFYNELPDTTSYLKIIAAEAFMISGERESVLEVLDAIQSEDPEITNSVEYLRILCDTLDVWDTVVNLNSAQLQSLQSITQSGTRVAYNAKALLEIALDTVYDEVIESIEIADSLTISGHLHESSNCSNNEVAGDTLLIKSPQGMVYTKVSPVVTDSNGYFKFNPMELSLINDTVEFTISTKNSFSVDAAGTGTRAGWIGQSPLHLMLEKLHRSWKYDFENVAEMMAVSKSLALADQVYVAGSIYNPSTENTDAVLLKLDTAGNMLWNVYYDGEGGDNKVMDFYVDDSSKVYLLVYSEIENEPLTEIGVYDSSGNLKWNVQLENIKVGKQIIGNNDGYIFVGGDHSKSDNQYSYLYRYTETGSVDGYTSFEETNTPFEFVALAMLNDTTILSACVDLYSNTTYVYANKADDGTAENEFSLGDFKAVDLLSDDGSIYLSGNGALGGLVLTQKINAGYEIEWSAGEESDLIYTTPGCLAKDTNGNISVLYYDNVGFGITSYDADGYENWSVSESGDWYSEIEKLMLKTDEEGNLYTLLASNNFELGGMRSYIYKHNTIGEKQWEQFFEYTRLYDFGVSENGNIYTSGSLYLADNEYSLSTYKYSQCYITANLRSAADSPNTQNLSEPYVKLYPNPNDGSMQLEYLLPENLTGTFELYDLTGRRVYSFALPESSGLKSISAHNLTRGVYMYKVASGDKTVDLGKVVVIK